MIKRISHFVFPVLFFALIILLTIPQKAAASSNQTETNTTTTFTIQGGNLHDAHDAIGKPILKPEHGGIRFDASLNGRTAELPVGSKIVLWFPGGGYEISIKNPSFPGKNVVDAAKGIYHLPKNEIGLLEVVGQGTATITVTRKVGSGKGNINAEESQMKWSGYAHNGITGSYTDITSYWTIPTASCGFLSTTDASTWAGIDGNNNGYLIQTGTESHCNLGVQQYDTWYEVINTPSNPEPSIITCSNSSGVTGGDSMFAEVKQVSGSTWTITIKDLTRNLDCSPSSNQTFSGPQSSAEWIVERPTNPQTGTLYTLTDYGSTSFFNNTLNGANPQHSYATDSIEMTSDGTSTGTPLSNPSYPNNLTDAFSVYYCPSTGCPTANPPAEGWSVQSSPTGGINNILEGAASTTSSDAWAVGYDSTGSGAIIPAAYHWNGSTWGTNAISGYSSGYHVLVGVSEISSTDVLAVGNSQTSSTSAFALHGDGTSWSSLSVDSPGTTNSGLNGVASVSSGDAWAVGSTYESGDYHPLIEQYQGSTTGFTKFNDPFPNLSGTTDNELTAVTVHSSTDAWAVGFSRDSNNQFQPLTYHWNGTSWTNVTAPLPSGISGANLRGVTEISANNVWAVGFTNTSSKQTYIIHWDGSSWNIVSSPNPNPNNELYAVSAVSANEVYAAGTTYPSGASTPLVLKYDGTQWQQETVPPAGSSSNSLNGITVPASGEAFAVGYFTGNSTFSPLIDRLSIKYSPTTQATLSPTQNSDGTYPNPVTVTLAALPPPGATIANIYYTIDSGSQQTYSSPFTVSGNGSHTITYWSVDSNGNQEAVNTKTFTLVSYNLTGTVYIDINDNGTQDTGESGYAGATITLNTGQTATTSADGTYSFSNLPAGTYTETLTVPTGYTASTTNPASISLSTDTTQNFGITTVIASDTFQRANQTYWGTASDGNAWGADASNNSHFSISSNTGLASGTSGILSGSLGPSETDEQALVTAETSSFSGSTDFDVLLRYTDSNNWYKAYLNGSNIYIRRMQNGTNTQIASAPFSASANTLYTIRFQVVGEILSAKVWAASGSEPATWTVSVDDTALTSGKCGIGINNSSGANLTFTSFTAYNIPTQAVPTPAAPSGGTLSAKDTFQRTNRTYWGTASDGNNTWGADAANNSHFSISSNTGKVSGSSGIINGSLGATTYDSEVDATATTTSFSGTDFGVLLRYTDNNNWYKVYLDGSNLVIRRMLAGNNTQIASASFNATIATPYSFRFKAVGYNLYAKVWASSSTEPSNWTVATTDTNLISGKSGVGINNSSGNTVQYTSFAYYSFATPSTLGQDTFQRTNQTYWGTASDGNIWAGDANSNSVFSISNNTGLVTNTGNTSYSAILGTTATNEEVLFTGKLSDFSNTPNIGAVLRFTDGNNWYKAYFDGSNLIIQKKVSGTATTISTTPFTASANNLYSLRFRISGTSLSAKVWLASDTEPTNWTATATDSSLSSAGYAGLRILTHSATATITSFLATGL